MTSKINPSPALVARADTPLSECVKIMNDHRIGSVLIVSEKGQADLVGIFTERDLLVKFPKIVENQMWSKPIRDVMTSPVATLDISQIQEAADFMLKRNCRHCPITLTDATQSRQILAGIISMRDIFKSLVKESKGSASWFNQSSSAPGGSAGPLKKVGIFSRDQNFYAFLNKMFIDFALGKVSPIEFSKPASLLADVLIIDLDGLEPSIWTQYLKKLNQDTQVKAAVVVFDPLRQSSEVGGLLEKMGQSGKFTIFRKPIDILSFFERVNTLSLEGRV